jgi:hypothetical protein
LRCKGDRDGEGDGDSEGERDGDGEGDEGRRRYLKEDGDIEMNNAPCDTDRIRCDFKFRILCVVRFAITNGAGGIGGLLVLAHD